eukprot:3334545-Rhodomonas_salina.1
MSCTDLAYAATREGEGRLPRMSLEGMLLRIPYAVSSTDLGCWLRVCYAVSGTDLCYRPTRFGLRVLTSAILLSLSLRVVLTEAMLLRYYGTGMGCVGTDLGYAGTDLGYAGTRLAQVRRRRVRVRRARACALFRAIGTAVPRAAVPREEYAVQRFCSSCSAMP